MNSLFITPDFFVYMEALREHLARRKGARVKLGPVGTLPA